jgi:capsular polysaccharide biosynthesis protein
MPQAIPSHESERPSPGVIDPPPSRPTVGDATRRYWPLVLVAVLVLGAFGAYTGHSRKPVYTASASLSVGLLDVTTQSVPGFAVGGEVVASGYSRAVQTDGVIDPVAQRLKMTPAEVRSHVSSTPVPNSPIFTVTATAESAGSAVTLANAVSQSMIAYGRSHASTDAASARLLARYQSAVRNRNRARNRVAQLRSGSSTTAGSSGTASTASTASDSGSLSQARADLEVQQLRMDTLADQYRARTSTPGNTAVLQPLVNAQGAASDRGSKTQLYGALGVLAGLCLGTALAVLLAGWRFRRRHAF